MTSRLIQASLFALSEATNLFKDSGVCSLGKTRKSKKGKSVVYEVCIKVLQNNSSSHKHFSILRKNQKWNCI
jgi:hypothetical protein